MGPAPCLDLVPYFTYYKVTYKGFTFFDDWGIHFETEDIQIGRVRHPFRTGFVAALGYASENDSLPSHPYPASCLSHAVNASCLYSCKVENYPEENSLLLVCAIRTDHVVHAVYHVNLVIDVIPIY